MRLRFWLLRLGLLGLLVLFLGRLWTLQVGGEIWRQEGRTNRLRLIPLPAPRGVIYDREGRILAENVPQFVVQVDRASLPRDRRARWALYLRLSALLDLPVALTVDGGALPEDRIPALAAELAARLPVDREAAYERLREARRQGARLPLWTPADPQDLLPALDWILEESALDLDGEVARAVERADLPLYLPVPVARRVDRETAMAVAEARPFLPGVEVAEEAVRRYPAGPLTAHVLGYLGAITEEELKAAREAQAPGEPPLYLPTDRVGKAGLEATYEGILRGRRGWARLEVDALQRPAGPLQTVEAPEPGSNLVLTLDLDLQAAVERALRRGIEKANRERKPYHPEVYAAVGALMEVETGRLLALVSLPSYDDNLFAGGIDPEAYRQLLEDPRRPLFDRAVAGVYPPGSTFKQVTGAAALQEGVATPRTVIFDPGAIVVPSQYDPSIVYRYPCWKPGGHGEVDFATAYAQSCNVYFFTLGGGNPTTGFQGLGPKRLAAYARAFGLGQRTGIPLPGEAEGLIPTPEWKALNRPEEPWTLGDTYNMAIGQGNVLVTPIQMLRLTAAVANGGLLYRPQLVLQIQHPDGRIEEVLPELQGNVPVDPQNLAAVREGLRAVVTQGSGRLAALDDLGIAVAGKTGTAEFGPVYPQDGRQNSHAWFVGFAPYEDPEVAVVVLVEGGGQSWSIAAPVAGEILRAYFLKTRPELRSPAP